MVAVVQQFAQDAINKAFGPSDTYGRVLSSSYLSRILQLPALRELNFTRIKPQISFQKMNSPSVIILIFLFSASVNSHGRGANLNTPNSSNASLEYQKQQIEEVLKKNYNDNRPCSASGYYRDGSENCAKLPEISSRSDGSKLTSKQKTTSVGSLLSKHKAEAIQRCGVAESPGIKISKIVDSEKDEFHAIKYMNDPDFYGPSWIAIYSEDTGRIVFGERQFQNRECHINKKTGEARWR